MRGWSTLLLIALLGMAAAGSDAATAQGMRGPPPPRGGQQGPQDHGPEPPPSPPPNEPRDPFADRDAQSRPPPPPPPPPQQQQAPYPGPAAVVPAPDVQVVPAYPSPSPVVQPIVLTVPDVQTTNPDRAPVPVEEAKPRWPNDTVPPAIDAAPSPKFPRPAPASAAAKPNAAQPADQRQPAAEGTMPRWLWLLALALPIALLLLSMTFRKTLRLESETEQLARHQRMLQNVNRNLQGESEHLRHLAINDPLTGTLNRRAFADELRALLDHLAKFGRPLDLIVFDLDHFKSINDQQGHLAGDAALKLVAGLVRKFLNSDDLFGRFGGDEFLIACADRTLDETTALADGIRRAVVAESTVCDPPLPGLSLSIGIARASRASGYHLDDLFHRADTALYSAKRGGRNRVVLADDALPQPPASEITARQLA